MRDTHHGPMMNTASTIFLLFTPLIGAKAMIAGSLLIAACYLLLPKALR